MSLYYGGNLTQSKRREFWKDIGIPSLATIITEKSSLNPFGWSWQAD